MKAAVCEYGAGNVRSVVVALARLGVAAEATSDAARVAAADLAVLPGVGSAASAMTGLRERGLDDAVRERVAAERPTLGICLGLQLALERSDEDGGTECLGLLPGRAVRLGGFDGTPLVVGVRWSFRGKDAGSADSGVLSVRPRTRHRGDPRAPAAQPVFRQALLEPGSDTCLTPGRVPRIGWAAVEPYGDAFYFAHSYAAETPTATAWSEGIVAEARAGSFVGVQFHPEKSGAAGARYLEACLSRV